MPQASKPLLALAAAALATCAPSQPAPRPISNTGGFYTGHLADSNFVRILLRDTASWRAVRDSFTPYAASAVSEGPDSPPQPPDLHRVSALFIAGPGGGIEDSLGIRILSASARVLHIQVTAYFNCNPADLIVIHARMLTWPRKIAEVSTIEDTVWGRVCARFVGP